MAKLSTDTRVATLHPRENFVGSGNIAALNGFVEIYADGCSTGMLTITGAYNGTMTVEASNDNWATFDVLPIKPVNAGGLFVLTLASAAVGRFICECAGFQKVRARMSAFTSGQASVVLIADNAISELLVIPKAADQHAEILGTAGAAATLTIPSPGAGLFQIVKRLLVQRIPTAALTAAAAAIAVTTTNLRGTRTIRLPADAGAQGVIASDLCEVDILASVANTAVTIVMPLTTGVQWFASADYVNLPEG